MFSPFFSPDANPLDFSIWARLAAAICDDVPKNRQDLIDRIQERWNSILDQDYVVRVCEAVPGRLRRIVEAKGDHIRPKDKENNNEDDVDSDTDENNNI